MNRQTASRWTSLALTVVAGSGLATAQSASLPSETYGSSCGSSLTVRSAAPDGVTLAVEGATPGAQVVLILGTRAIDRALPGTSCRLLAEPGLVVPLTANARGGAATTLPLPGFARGLLHAQAVSGTASGGLETSSGLALSTGPTTQRQGRTLAIVRLGSAEFEFIEPRPGEVLVVGSGPGTPPTLPGDRFDAVELYQQLSGRPAPDALRRAAAASNAAQTAVPEPDEPSAVDLGGSGGNPGPNACFSSNWFVSNFCQSGSGWAYCYVNNYSNPWAGSFSSWMLGATACNSGSYLFQYRRKDAGLWWTPYSKEVDACHWYWYGLNGPWRSRRMQVILGNGDAKHLSVKGN